MEEITIQNVTFTYPQMNQPALRNVSCTIEEGAFVVLCGQSGCGKTSLLRLLKPALAPHGTGDGTILYRGREIQSLSLREQAETLGFVQQDPELSLVCDKVWHELAFGPESLGLKNSEIRARVAEMASFFGIEDWFHKSVATLSGGQKQLLHLASVMVMRPSVLLLDEPTAQLDPIAAHDFLETLYQMNRELGTTVILSEHRLEEALPLADYVIVLDNGEVVTQGTPQETGCVLHEKRHEMFAALPTPMRLYYTVQNDRDCPLTVREGRSWLSSMHPQNVAAEREEERAANKEALLNAQEIWFRYEKKEADVVSGLSLTLHKGELYALMGGNGTGKSTVLSVLMGLRHPYRGRVVTKSGNKISALPQNPQSLFSRKTVWLELCDVAAQSGLPQAEAEKNVCDMLAFCELQELSDRHPFDLSGGEQQRLALAMVLLCRPDILLLDEPTKGLDVYFKQKLATLLKSLQHKGMAVLMVSHDVEFCAQYADCCGLMFDGRIVSEGAPRTFFGEKYFYTTAAARMANGIVQNAVLEEDLIRALGAEPLPKQEPKPNDAHVKNDATSAENLPAPKTAQKKRSKLQLVLGTVFGLLFFAALVFMLKSSAPADEKIFEQLLSVAFLSVAAVCLLPQKEASIHSVKRTACKRKISKRTLAASMISLAMIPLTVLFGVYVLEDKKYYFISLLVILEGMLPFLLIFEGRKPQARELVLISVLCAVGVAGRAAFAALPQFKPVAALVIITGVCFGGEAGFLVGAVTAFVSNFYFGQGPLTPWQMFAFGLIGCLAGLLFQKGLLKKNKISLSIFGFVVTLVLYGGIMNTSMVILYEPQPTISLVLASCAVGFPFDLVHAVSTVFFLWFAGDAMCEKLERVKVKYGLYER